MEPPAILAVTHPYSDAPDAGIWIRGYSFEEVFAEKIRAFAERERPRDLYDVVSMYRQRGETCDVGRIRGILKKKCTFKQITFPTMGGLQNRPEQQELKAEWKNMLAHQMAELPDFEKFWHALQEVIWCG